MTLNAKQQNKIIAAMDALDHTVDANWNDDGTPSLDAIIAATKLTGLKQEDLTAVAGDFVRVVDKEGDAGQQPNVAGGHKIEDDKDKPESEDESEGLQESEDELEVQLAKAQDELNKAVADHAETTKRLADSQNLVAHLSQQIERKSHPHRDRSAATVAGYLASQRERRSKLADAINQQPRSTEAEQSQLDRAMARKTGYGRTRPPVTLIK